MSAAPVSISIFEFLDSTHQDIQDHVRQLHGLVDAERVLVLTRRPARIVLDRAIDLPRERDASIRMEPAFAREVRALHEALERADS